MKLIITCICSFLLFGVKAQLPNTQWNGTVYLPDAHPVFWKFDKDTLTVFFTDSSFRQEVMTYKEDKDKKTLTVIKISGSSPCESGSTGVYTYILADDKLSMKPTQEPCEGRAASVAGVAFTRTK